MPFHNPRTALSIALLATVAILSAQSGILAADQDASRQESPKKSSPDITATAVGAPTQAIVATVKAMGFLAGAFQAPLGGLVRWGTKDPHPPEPSTTYSGEETKFLCKRCGQETVVRGNLPGLRITCPACGNALD